MPVPNPTAGRSELVLTVDVAQRVRVSAYDALGREVAVLHDGPLAAGVAHRVVLEGEGWPPGLYAVRSVGAGASSVRTVTIRR